MKGIWAYVPDWYISWWTPSARLFIGRLAGVSVPGTLVKVIFDSGTNQVRQAELED